jgi:hypothetical protein
MNKLIFFNDIELHMTSEFYYVPIVGNFVNIKLLKLMHHLTDFFQQS